MATEAERIVDLLRQRDETIATAESLTGGLLAAALVSVPGASHAFRGGIVAYATDLKHSLLGVDADLLEARGAVDAEVARHMARGALERLGASWGIGTTGAAGPTPDGTAPPGRVHLAVVGPLGVRSEQLDLPGDRAAVRAAATSRALALALRTLLDAGVMHSGG